MIQVQHWFKLYMVLFIVLHAWTLCMASLLSWIAGLMRSTLDAKSITKSTWAVYSWCKVEVQIITLTIEINLTTFSKLLVYPMLYPNCSYNVAENKAHFVMECPLYNAVRDKLPSIFENVVLGGILKFFLTLDHHFDICFYLMEMATPSL